MRFAVEKTSAEASSHTMDRGWRRLESHTMLDLTTETQGTPCTTDTQQKHSIRKYWAFEGISQRR
jgi:hypothetical protein